MEERWKMIDLEGRTLSGLQLKLYLLSSATHTWLHHGSTPSAQLESSKLKEIFNIIQCYFQRKFQSVYFNWLNWLTFRIGKTANFCKNLPIWEKNLPVQRTNLQLSSFLFKSLIDLEYDIPGVVTDSDIHV